MADQEAGFAGPAPSSQRRIIHFSSGETLEEQDSEEEEEQVSKRERLFCGQPTDRTGFSFKNVALLVGRISLLTCDFLGERLASAFGLNAAKYQYAIDQHQRDHKNTNSQVEDGLMGGKAETIHLTDVRDGSHYGATADAGRPADPRGGNDNEHVNRKGGYHNRSYQTD